MMSSIDVAAIDMAADMVTLFHVRKENQWSPDYIKTLGDRYDGFDFDQLYLKAQILFPVMLVRYVAGLPLIESE